MGKEYQSQPENYRKTFYPDNVYLERELTSRISLLSDHPLFPSSIISLFKQYLDEVNGPSWPSICMSEFANAVVRNKHMLAIFKFVELVHKIKETKEPHEEDRLEPVLEDIKELGRLILDLEADDPSIITTIITKALQPSEEKPSDVVGATSENIDVLRIEPKPEKGVLSSFIDWLVDHILEFINHAQTESEYLKDNFAPVEKETPPTTAVIINGQVPENLNGVMIRNGPNPQFVPVARYEWLDGDSMLHAVYFKQGKVSYASRYVETSRFKQEKFFGRAEFLQYGDLRGSFGVFMACVQLLKQKLGILDMSQGWFNGNTGAIYHAGFLMVYEDFDKPYAINVLENGDLETLGINNYNNKLTHNFTAHPKKDPKTGEMFILGSSYTPPYAIYNVVDKDGVLGNSLDITISEPTYMHDFGLTEKYVIFMDLSYRFNPEIMVENDDWVYSYDVTKNARFGILPRYAKDQTNMKWFEFDNSFFIFHNGNSWEEDNGDTIILISCVIKESNEGQPSLIFGDQLRSYSSPLRSSRKHDKHVKIGLPILNKLSFNMTTGTCSRTQLSKTYCDYPKVNERFIGRKTKYVYTTEFDDTSRAIGVVKHYLQWESESKLYFEEGKYSSEVTFISRQSDTIFEEDDGYLTTFVYDDKESKSFAYVICAKKMELLATVELKDIRVPYGFHAVFVTEEELKEQRKRIKSSTSNGY